ncbi:MAG: lipid-A-disaccharide synthase [Pseudomonadales bacterium]|nr:lipid-A-disaccharide synthase [Pseudomonadales bacterium]MCP5182839.1 lipid-A-disaccharide synthase [Pseudomonadales bacterium]
MNGVALRLGVVAGETSGDQLGAGLMAALREQCAARGQAVSFVGIGGEEMLALGLQSIAPLSALSVSGFVDPIRHLPRVLGVLRRLLRSFREQPPDAVVGIDFNVFNLFMERRLKRAGVPTVHYVSPSVYGWRPGRVRSMPNSADLLLCLYPFEPPFYQGLAMRAAYVGHPLCQALNAGAGNETQRQAMKATLGLPGRELIALLPGSRRSEIRHMAPLFLDAAERLAQTPASRHFLLPCVREDLRRELELLLAAHPRLPVTLLAENARRALVACDGALIKSGTGTLEALCLGRPMVVSYRVGRWSYQLAKRLIRTPYVALPNILAGRAVVPELLQDEATPERLAASLEDVMQRARLDPAVLAPLGELRESLAVGEGANVEAARAILTFLDERSAR